MGLMTAASDPRFWDISKAGCEYAVANMIMSGNGPSALPRAKKFIAAFKKRWGIEPGVVTGVECYTNPWILKDAIERAGTIDTDAVCEALLKIDMNAPYGKVRFDPKTHQIMITDDPETGAVCCWIQWQKPGKRICVWPPAGAMGKIQYPPWMKQKP
ncbi:MAG: ABC transporter substrate-binding protein [Thermodesulfobacteriota bacterium]|nr:ABC transporter substrate-binding protein [Thermodesulfobacteriota bacterium]